MRRFLGAFTILSALSGCVTTQQDLSLPETTKYPLARVPEGAQTVWKNADGTLAGSPPAEATGLTPPPTLSRVEYRGVAMADGPTAETPGQGSVTSGTTPAGMPMAVTGSGTTTIPVKVAQNTSGPYSGGAIQPVGLSQSAPFYPPAGGSSQGSSSRDIPFQPTFTDLPHSQPVSNLKPLIPAPVRQSPPSMLSPAVTGANTNINTIIEVDPGTGSGFSPTIRMVNSKRFTLNYEIKDIGSSGVTTVDLWCTRDSRSWKRYETAFQHQHAHIVEVREEGLYGFTLVARSGAGLSKDAPKAGDQPQIWVMVDLTRPVVNLEGVEISLMAKSPALVIRWNAQDRNFASRPISLLIADQPTGPWTTIASGLENTGRFDWVPPGTPRRAYLRVEAVDQAGNVGAADTATAIRIDFPWSASNSSPAAETAHNVIQAVSDQIRPTVSILGVETRDR